MFQSESVQHTLRLMKSNQQGKDVSFGDILGSAQGLLLFVEHLEREFRYNLFVVFCRKYRDRTSLCPLYPTNSVENILFIVFVAKYREHYMSKIIPPLLAKQGNILKSKRPLSAGSSASNEEEFTFLNQNITPTTTPNKTLKFFKFGEKTPPMPVTPITPMHPDMDHADTAAIDHDGHLECSPGKDTIARTPGSDLSDPKSVSPKSCMFHDDSQSASK